MKHQSVAQENETEISKKEGGKRERGEKGSQPLTDFFTKKCPRTGSGMKKTS